MDELISEPSPSSIEGLVKAGIDKLKPVFKEVSSTLPNISVPLTQATSSLVNAISNLCNTNVSPSPVLGVVSQPPGKTPVTLPLTGTYDRSAHSSLSEVPARSSNINYKAPQADVVYSNVSSLKSIDPQIPGTSQEHIFYKDVDTFKDQFFYSDDHDQIFYKTYQPTEGQRGAMPSVSPLPGGFPGVGEVCLPQNLDVVDYIVQGSSSVLGESPNKEAQASEPSLGANSFPKELEEAPHSLNVIPRGQETHESQPSGIPVRSVISSVNVRGGEMGEVPRVQESSVTRPYQDKGSLRSAVPPPSTFLPYAALNRSSAVVVDPDCGIKYQHLQDIFFNEAGRRFT